MRVCLVSREYPTEDHGGGIGTYTEKTARALASIGVSVQVITEAVGEPSVTMDDGVAVHRLASVRVPRLRTASRAIAVARTLERLDPGPDIVQACEYGAEAVWFALRKPRTTKLVTRLATPSFLVRELNGDARSTGGIAGSQLDHLEHLQTRRSDAVISITDALAEVVCARWRIPRSRVTVMPTGVDFDARLAPRAAPLPPELAGRDYLLFFGRLEERKGVHVLAQALPAVLEANPGIHVVFAGNSLEYRDRPMREYVARCNMRFLSRLHFFPRLRQEELHPVLENAALVVLPSLWEGMGNVALEALDMGRPIVATLGCGFGEVIEDGRSGVLVAPGDKDALQQALLGLLADRDRLDQLTRGARLRASAFELTALTRELVRFYEAVLSGAPSIVREAS